jgi:hypothetical protein
LCGAESREVGVEVVRLTAAAAACRQRRAPKPCQINIHPYQQRDDDDDGFVSRAEIVLSPIEKKIENIYLFLPVL